MLTTVVQNNIQKETAQYPTPRLRSVESKVDSRLISWYWPKGMLDLMVDWNRCSDRVHRVIKSTKASYRFFSRRTIH